MDFENIKAIKDWATTTSVTDIRSFLGLGRYYRNFIENFSRIACPMTALQKEENKFIWTDKCEESFQKLKKLLVIAPVLHIPYPPMGISLFAQMQARKEFEESSCKMIA